MFHQISASAKILHLKVYECFCVDISSLTQMFSELMFGTQHARKLSLSASHCTVFPNTFIIFLLFMKTTNAMVLSAYFIGFTSKSAYLMVLLGKDQYVSFMRTVVLKITGYRPHTSE